MVTTINVASESDFDNQSNHFFFLYFGYDTKITNSIFPQTSNGPNFGLVDYMDSKGGHLLYLLPHDGFTMIAWGLPRIFPSLATVGVSPQLENTPRLRSASEYRPGSETSSMSATTRGNPYNVGVGRSHFVFVKNHKDGISANVRALTHAFGNCSD